MTPPTLTSDDLTRYQQRLRDLGLEIAERILPGLSSDEIDARMSPLGLRLPDEAQTWFRWQGGFEHPQFDLEIAPDFVLMSLDQAIEWYRQVRVGAIVEIWPAAWFPIVTSYGTVVCDCSVSPESPTPIRVIDQNDPRRPFAGSLGEMLSRWNRSWDIGAWSADGPIRMRRCFEQPEPDGTRNLLVDV